MQAVVFEHLKRGRPLSGLGLPVFDGRILVDGMVAPQPMTKSIRRVAGLNLHLTQGDQFVRGKVWKGIHFRDCDLSSIGFFSQVIDNCVFERCKCRGIGFWKSSIEHTVFDTCELRDAALGGNDMVKPGPRNEYRSVTFRKCDMRNTGYTYELFEDCTFDHCRLDKVDFGGSVFRGCTFSGPLVDVTFNRENRLFKIGEPNVMENSDFSSADVTWCKFAGIPMRLEWFGSNDDLILLPDGPEDWRRWLGRFEGDPRFPGMGIFAETVLDCGTPAIANRSLLLECGFTVAEIDLLARSSV